ncbi:hypothetical protein [Streptomyces sp. CB03911]|uniref:hypothetical protein n=1 Tax=Streptomycetaceae TaxID=2062 RepID=UPI00093FD5AF|nr:hypothetical protein [Streptomyces sp. CB03911]OKI20905.1 hypothetical protein A6A07_36130 [Streptomyces sp. CB03911]
MPLPAAPASPCPVHGVPDNCADLMRQLAKAQQASPAQPRTVVVQESSSHPLVDARTLEARAANRDSLRNALWLGIAVIAVIGGLTVVKLLGWVNGSIPAPHPSPAATVTVTAAPEPSR